MAEISESESLSLAPTLGVADADASFDLVVAIEVAVTFLLDLLLARVVLDEEATVDRDFSASSFALACAA